MGNGVIALVIAAVLAALATVLFRSSPRREETDRSSPVEQVVIPAVPPVEPIGPDSPAFSDEVNLGEPPVAADAGDGLVVDDPTINPSAGTEGFAAMPIGDPWAPETSGGEGLPPLDEPVSLLDVSQADPIAPFPPSDTPGEEQPVELVLDHPNASFVMNAIGADEGATGPFSETSPGMDGRFTRVGGDEDEAVAVPLVPLQDPSRPATSELADLSQDILEWGDTQDLGQLDRLLGYADHPDSTIRSCVALAVGKLARGHVTNPAIAPAISALGTLSQDSDDKVSLLAVQALAALQSPQARPYLVQARLHSSAKVINAANLGLQDLA